MSEEPEDDHGPDNDGREVCEKQKESSGRESWQVVSQQYPARRQWRNQCRGYSDTDDDARQARRYVCESSGDSAHQPYQQVTASTVVEEACRQICLVEQQRGTERAETRRVTVLGIVVSCGSGELGWGTK